MKSKEELLSEEVRTYAELATRTLQWGVTLMISVQTALFFVRHEIVAADIDANKLPKGSELPMGRYIIGTVFLIFLALVLSKLTARVLTQYRHYKSQLSECRESGVTDLPIQHAGRWAYALYFAFPVIDIGVRIALFKIGFR